MKRKCDRISAARLTLSNGPSFFILLSAVLSTASVSGVVAETEDQKGSTDEVPAKLAFAVAPLVPIDPLSQFSTERRWTSQEGAFLVGRLLAVHENSVDIRLSDGRPVNVPLDRLIPDDLEHLRQRSATAAFFDFDWSPKVTDAPKDFTGGFDQNQTVLETPNFRVECESGLDYGDFRDLAELLEGARALLKRQPLALAIRPEPSGKFQVKLFDSTDSFERAGGPPEATSFFHQETKTVLSLRNSIKSWNGRRELGHETTHALMHQWIEYLPAWFMEGIAELLAAAVAEGVGEPSLARMDKLIDSRLLEVESEWSRELMIRARCLELMKISGLIQVAKGDFRGKTEENPPAYRLAPVEPVRITLAKNGFATSAPTIVVPTSIPARSPYPDEMLVDYRHAASMALVGHLLKNETPERLRSFLAALVDARNERASYLALRKSEKEKFDAEVEKQEKTFFGAVKSYREAVEKYNEAIVKLLAFENLDRQSFPAQRFAIDDYGARVIENLPQTKKAPEKPKAPMIPEPMAVPEILAKPRTPEELSDSEIFRRCHQLISIPPSLDDFR